MDVSDLIKKTLHQIQDLMVSKTVVGDPIQAGDNIVIPVSKVVFGFAGGGGEGKEAKTAGTGQGVGGGWSIEPVAFVVVGKEGAKLLTIGVKESLTGKLMDLAPKVVETVKDIVEKKTGEKTREDKE